MGTFSITSQGLVIEMNLRQRNWMEGAECSPSPQVPCHMPAGMQRNVSQTRKVQNTESRDEGNWSVTPWGNWSLQTCWDTDLPSWSRYGLYNFRVARPLIVPSRIKWKRTSRVSQKQHNSINACIYKFWWHHIIWNTIVYQRYNVLPYFCFRHNNKRGVNIHSKKNTSDSLCKFTEISFHKRILNGSKLDCFSY